MYINLIQAQNQKSFRNRFLRSWSQLKGENEEGILRLSLSPCGKYLVSVHFSGKVCLWAAQSLKLQTHWKHDQQVCFFFCKCIMFLFKISDMAGLDWHWVKGFLSRKNENENKHEMTSLEYDLTTFCKKLVDQSKIRTLHKSIFTN